MATRKAAKPEFVEVERKVSRRGRKAIDKPGMRAMVESWSRIKVGSTVILPDFVPGEDLHSAVTLARHHFKKYANEAGLAAGIDFTIESHDEYGATITRLK